MEADLSTLLKFLLFENEAEKQTSTPAFDSWNALL
jgi:hypothetical protein